MRCLIVMIQCLMCVTSSEMQHYTENTTATALVNASVIPKVPVRLILQYLETPLLGDSVRIRPKDYEFLLNPSVLYFNGQNRWSPANINPLHHNTNVYLIRTKNKIVKLFGIEHAYSSPYILMSVLELEPSQLCIRLQEYSIEYLTCICSPGYTKSSSDKCVACAAGTYKVITGNVACTICPGNSLSPTGSNSSAQCSCPVGTSIYYPNSTRAESCIQCPANFSRSATGSEFCQACEARHFAQPGSPICSCKPGFQGFPACDVCDIGYYSSTLDNTIYCLQCPGRKTSAMNSTSAADCACAPGFREDSANVCSPCPATTYESGGVCTPCGVQSDALQGSTQCSCNKGSIRGADGLCTCDKEYSLQSQNTGVCQPCPFNSYKPLIGNTPCVPCPTNQWSTAYTSQCHCKPGFGTHAQPAVVKAMSQFCWGQYTNPPAMSGTISTANILFQRTISCTYEVRAPSSSTTIQIISVGSGSHLQEIHELDQKTNFIVSTTSISPWIDLTGRPTFATGYLRIRKRIIWNQNVLPHGDWERFSFSWSVLPTFTCNFCNANMYQDSTGLYSQCHPCPDQKSSPPASTSLNQCS